tara:strand:+ start:154 stop:603 length:450 start_codon:yes stop_codon:yes gene_type:complete
MTGFSNLPTLEIDMKYALVLVAVLVAITITSHDVQASSHTSLSWSFGNYGYSDTLKMSPCPVMRSEHGYVAYPKIQRYQVSKGFTVTSDINGVRVNNYHKTMGEGETQAEMPFRWEVEAYEDIPTKPQYFGWDWNLIPQPNALGSIHNF